MKPHPKILLESVDKKSYQHVMILEAPGIWAVLHSGKVFNMKSQHYTNSLDHPRYRKTTFVNPGHAHSLARKLNTKFKTDQFSVEKIA